MTATSQEISALDKQVKALRMRQAGIGYEEIAKQCGYKNASGAYKAVRAGMKKTLQEPADELRRLELARLDAALLAIWTSVKQGHLGAIDRFLKISERRSRLLGLDATQEINLNAEVLTGDIEAIRAKRWQGVTQALIGLDLELTNETTETE